MYGNHSDAILQAVNAVHPNAFVGTLQPENSSVVPPVADAVCCGGSSSCSDIGGGGCEQGQLVGTNYQAAACRGAGEPTEPRDTGSSCGDHASCHAGVCGVGGDVRAQPEMRIGNFVVGGWPKARENGAAGWVEIDSIVPTVVVYIGEEGAELTRLMLENAALRFLLFSTSESARGGCEGGAIVPEELLIDSSKALKRRYYLMMKAKDAERIGIVVATTAVSGYGAMLHRLKAVIRSAGKRPYVFYVGKINPAKLANFAEMDVLVLVASPETCAAVDAAEYWKPLITPMECEIALVKGRTWTGLYDLDFRPLLATALPAPRGDADGAAGSDTEDEVSHSLMTGTVTVRVPGALTVPCAGEVMMTQRTFTGLDLNEGLDRPLDLVQGRVGIASGYSHEPSATTNQLVHTRVTDGTRVPAHMEGHASGVNYRVSDQGGGEGGVGGGGRSAAEPVVSREQMHKGADDNLENTSGVESSGREYGAASEQGDCAGGGDEPGGEVGPRKPTACESEGGRDDESDMQRVAEDVDDFLALLAS